MFEGQSAYRRFYQLAREKNGKFMEFGPKYEGRITRGYWNSTNKFLHVARSFDGVPGWYDGDLNPVHPGELVEILDGAVDSTTGWRDSHTIIKSVPDLGVHHIVGAFGSEDLDTDIRPVPRRFFAHDPHLVAFQIERSKKQLRLRLNGKNLNVDAFVIFPGGTITKLQSNRSDEEELIGFDTRLVFGVRSRGTIIPTVVVRGIWQPYTKTFYLTENPYSQKKPTLIIDMKKLRIRTKDQQVLKIKNLSYERKPIPKDSIYLFEDTEHIWTESVPNEVVTPSIVDRICDDVLT